MMPNIVLYKNFTVKFLRVGGTICNILFFFKFLGGTSTIQANICRVFTIKIPSGIIGKTNKQIIT